MSLRLRLLALLAVVALGASRSASAGDIRQALLENASVNLSPVPATLGIPSAPPPPDIAHLDLGRVPWGAIPATLDPSSAPPRIAEGDPPASLRFADVTRLQLTRFKANRDQQLEVHIEGAEPGASVGFFTRAGLLPSPNAKLTTYCNKTSPVTGMRWEHFSIAESGQVTLAIDDGWFDPLNCSALIERRTTLHPIVVHTDRGLPLAFAVRNDAGLTLLFAPGTNIAADASGELGQGIGVVRRVTVPLERGGAASVLASVSAIQLAQWRLRAMGREVPANASSGDVAITLGIDAVQTVSDGQPSVTTRSFEQTIGQGISFRSAPFGAHRSFLPRKK